MAFAEQPQCCAGVGWAEEKGRRDEMEDGFVFVDAFGDNPKAGFFAVYDGHGGRDTVDEVCKHLHVKLWEELQLRKVDETLKDNQHISDSIVTAFEKTDEYIINNGRAGGAVVCTCFVWEDCVDGTPTRRLYTAHCGDARAVMARGSEGVRLTSLSDHKASDHWEQIQVEEAGGTIMNERVNGMLAITRALGDPLLKKPRLPNNVVSNVPDITATPITEIDKFLIIACDGLWDVIRDQEAVDFVYAALKVLQEEGIAEYNHGLTASIIAKMLIKHSLSLNTTDNVTCMIIFL